MLNDEAGAGSLDSESRGFSLSGSYTPFSGINLSPSASLTESRSSGVLKRTRLASITAGMPVYKPYADTNLQLSYSLDDASDGSQDSTNLNGTWRLSANIHKLIKKWVDYDGQVMLALTANYNRIDDDVTPSNSKEDMSIFLSISIFTPINWAGEF